MTQIDVRPAVDLARASMASIRSVAAHRRARDVDLWTLGAAFGRSGSWLSRALRGLNPLSRGQVKELRRLIDDLAEAPR